MKTGKTGQEETGEIKDKIIGNPIVVSHVIAISICVSTLKNKNTNKHMPTVNL